MGQAQINVRIRACSRTSIARTKQAALTHNVRGKELKVSATIYLRCIPLPGLPLSSFRHPLNSFSFPSPPFQRSILRILTSTEKSLLIFSSRSGKKKKNRDISFLHKHSHAYSTFTLLDQNNQYIQVVKIDTFLKNVNS